MLTHFFSCVQVSVCVYTCVYSFPCEFVWGMCIHVGAHFCAYLYEVCVYTCGHISLCICMCTWACVYMYVPFSRLFVWGMCAWVCIYMSVHASLCWVYIHGRVYTCVCMLPSVWGMYAWVCVYMCIHESLCMEYVFVSVCIDVEIRGWLWVSISNTLHHAVNNNSIEFRALLDPLASEIQGSLVSPPALTSGVPDRLHFGGLERRPLCLHARTLPTEPSPDSSFLLTIPQTFELLQLPSGLWCCMCTPNLCPQVQA